MESLGRLGYFCRTEGLQKFCLRETKRKNNPGENEEETAIGEDGGRECERSPIEGLDRKSDKQGQGGGGPREDKTEKTDRG